jgi:acetyl-CoA decarbonylase/synthase complex subunit delta
MGVGKFYLISPKFISADGGFKRVVWMSKVLKETMADEFRFSAEREGIPDLVDRIADGNTVTSVEELVAWVKEKDHPVLDMGPMQAKSAEKTEEADDVIAQAEAVVEAAMTKPEAKPEVEEVEPAPEPEPETPAPKAEVSQAPPEEEKTVAPTPAAPSAPDTVDRAEKAVDILRRALVAALAELGGLDADELQAQATTAAPTVKTVETAPVVAEPEPEEEKTVLPPDKPWVTADTKIDIVKEKWAGQVREVVIGATADQGGSRKNVVEVGGETAMPFMDFEGSVPNKPVVAIEIKDHRPDDWSELLLNRWGDVVNDPAKWAKAAEEAGADLLLLSLSLTDENGDQTTPEHAVKTVREILEASGLPLIVFGPGQADVDNDLLVAVADNFKGERLLLGVCEDKNYRTIVASAMANGHLVNARTAMDVNLAKQLNILITDMGLPADQIIMDPTTGALGYGFEYGYSVMERLRLAALQGDSMTQMPMLVTPGEECWKAKESKVGEGVPEEWGDWQERAITWETLTSVMLIEAGANIVVLRHPESLKRTREAIEDLANQE